jgi:hypothetical protein
VNNCSGSADRVTLTHVRFAEFRARIRLLNVRNSIKVAQLRGLPTDGAAVTVTTRLLAEQECENYVVIYT